MPIQYLAYTNDFLSLILYILLPVVLSYAVNLLVHQIARIKNQAARDEAYTLVRWAQRKIPDKSGRYLEVAGLLHARFPWIDAAQVEQIIEAAVLDFKGIALEPVAVIAAPVAAPSQVVVADHVTITPNAPPPTPVHPAAVESLPTVDTRG